MTLDERIEALVMSVELVTKDVEGLRGKFETLGAAVERLYATAQQDGENIRALARIAEIHERRLTDLEGGSSAA